jgi:acyl phosphate:glycerol-3-phosphate acyltransferase
MIENLLALAAAYLLGSIPFGYVAGWMRGVDLRTLGSGNTGGTNAVRVLGPRYGLPVILLDVAKGVAAVELAIAVGGINLGVAAAAAAILGHTFPVFLGFGGGKGVATGAGATIGLAPIVGLLSVPIWLLTIALTGYVSVGSLFTAVAIPTMSVLFGEPPLVTGFLTVASLFVIYRHRQNIARLRAGTEPRTNVRGWWARRAAARSVRS